MFNVALDPKFIVKDFMYHKIAVFNSKKVPIMLSMMNAQSGGPNYVCLFKNGDDLRQDILTLQIISIMDKIWLAHNLDLKMSPYKVLGTHCEQGLLEFVPNCKTLAAIQYRGRIPFVTNKANIFNTFKDDTVDSFFKEEADKRLRTRHF